MTLSKLTSNSPRDNSHANRETVSTHEDGARGAEDGADGSEVGGVSRDALEVTLEELLQATEGPGTTPSEVTKEPSELAEDSWTKPPCRELP